jgi:EmrB/QacA subfamily drug resistance transporter
MDISIVNVALPAIGRGLGTAESGLQWAVDSYTLALTSCLLLAGSLADRFGRRRTFQVGLAVFGLGSLLCGLAPGIGWLIAARVFQGFGGSMLNPVALSIIVNAFPGQAERARAVGVFGSMTGLALALGPVLGGALVDGFGWHAVFLVNVPVLAFTMVCTGLFVPESRAARPRRFDPVGQLLVIAALGSLVYAVIQSASSGWGSPVILGLLAVAALSVLGLVGYERRRADPLLELRLFRSVPFSSALVMAACALCGFQSFLFVTTQYLQDVRGMSALTAGLCVLPVGALVLVLSPVTGRIVARYGARPPLTAAGTALALGGLASLWLAPATPLPAVVAVYALFGVFLSTVNPPVTTTAVSGMPRSMAGVAGGLVSAGRQTGTALGAAVAGTIVGSSLTRGAAAYTSAERGVWWLVIALGVSIVALGVFSTGTRVRGTAEQAAALFEQVDAGTAAGLPRTAG